MVPLVPLVPLVWMTEMQTMSLNRTKFSIRGEHLRNSELLAAADRDSAITRPMGMDDSSTKLVRQVQRAMKPGNLQISTIKAEAGTTYY